MGNMTEKQYLRMLKNITDEPLRKLKENGKTDEYDYVLENGFTDESEYRLLDGISLSDFCPCGLGIKYKNCCYPLVIKMVESLLNAKYVEAIETTEEEKKGKPLGFALSPVFEIDLDIEDSQVNIFKEVIRTHPTIVDHLYLISAKMIATARADSKYARYNYNLYVSMDEGTDFDFDASIENDEPLNAREREIFIYNKTCVPSLRFKMRNERIKLISNNRFVLY